MHDVCEVTSQYRVRDECNSKHTTLPVVSSLEILLVLGASHCANAWITCKAEQTLEIQVFTVRMNQSHPICITDV